MQHPHHFVIFVREDMTMPDITSEFVENRPDSRDLTGQGGHHFLRCFFEGLHGFGIAYFFNVG